MKQTDAEAFAYYDDPAHREPAPGEPRRGPERALTEHVPVRFPPAMIEDVRKLAETDGMTVSAWIRRAVDREVAEQRVPPSEGGELNEQALAAFTRLRRNVAELARALESPARRVPQRRRR